eukprot:6486869-Amphidinium_carterae.1
MSLLGWETAKDEKALSFAESFEVLGVVLALTFAGPLPELRISNKEKRKKEEASVILRRLQFAKGQILGRSAEPVCALLSDVLRGGSHRGELSDEEAERF